MNDLDLLNEMHDVGSIDCREGCNDWKALLELVDLGFVEKIGNLCKARRFILTEKGKEIVKEFKEIK